METRLYVLPVVLLEFEAPYNIETFIHIEKEIFLETENIYNKRSYTRHHHIRRLNQLPYLVTFID